MTGNYRSIFCFFCHLSLYLTVNILFSLPMLFKITFETSAWPFYSRNYKKHCIFYTNFKTSLLLLIENREKTPDFDYCKYGVCISCMIYRWGFKKTIAVVTFIVSSLVSFPNLMFSKYGATLATFPASSKLDSFALVYFQSKY